MPNGLTLGESYFHGSYNGHPGITGTVYDYDSYKFTIGTDSTFSLFDSGTTTDVGKYITFVDRSSQSSSYLPDESDFIEGGTGEFRRSLILGVHQIEDVTPLTLLAKAKNEETIIRFSIPDNTMLSNPPLIVGGETTGMNPVGDYGSWTGGVVSDNTIEAIFNNVVLDFGLVNINGIVVKNSLGGLKNLSIKGYTKSLERNGTTGGNGIHLESASISNVENVSLYGWYKGVYASNSMLEGSDLFSSFCLYGLYGDNNSTFKISNIVSTEIDRAGVYLTNRSSLFSSNLYVGLCGLRSNELNFVSGVCGDSFALGDYIEQNNEYGPSRGVVEDWDERERKLTVHVINEKDFIGKLQNSGEEPNTLQWDFVLGVTSDSSFTHGSISDVQQGFVGYGIYANNSSTAIAPYSIFNHCLGGGVYLENNSYADVHNSSVSSSAQSGYSAFDNSTIDARESVCTRCRNGFYASSNSSIDAVLSQVKGCYGVSFLAESKSNIVSHQQISTEGNARRLTSHMKSKRSSHVDSIQNTFINNNGSTGEYEPFNGFADSTSNFNDLQFGEFL